MEIRTYGRIFDPEVNLPAGYTHGSYPVGVELSAGANKFRVFYSARDSAGKSHVFWSDFEFDGVSFELVETAAEPVLSPGDLGLFDCDGISVGNVVADGNSLNLYYLGWQLQKSVPWMNTIGLASSKDFGNSFQKYSRVPILDRAEEDPFSMSYPWVLKTDAGFTVWYGSNKTWGESKGEMEHVIKRAESIDGIDWKRDAESVFDLSDKMTAMSRPSVVQFNDKDLMLVSIKNELDVYSIWFGKKNGSNTWDLSKLDIESDGHWDSEYRTYGSFFTFGGSLYVLYNGNGFGKTGFGILKLTL